MQKRRSIAFCRSCGHPTRYAVPEGDNRPRAICTQCDLVHYENPLCVVGTIPVWEGRVLLCLRNIEPRKGFWTLPAGFMELGESPAQGACRETQEEAGCDIRLESLFAIWSVAQVGQIHMFYRAQMLGPQCQIGEETQEARLFEESEIPWDDLAFPTISHSLHAYFHDRRQGVFTLHEGDL